MTRLPAAEQMRLCALPSWASVVEIVKDIARLLLGKEKIPKRD
jgi:hypothetical protein